MKSYGICFTNITKGEDPKKADAEFIAFASLCYYLGVSKFINEIDYSSGDCAFHIDVDKCYNGEDVGRFIKFAAYSTLSQFELFGYCYHKYDLDETP